MLEVPAPVRDRLVAHCIAALPFEGCGLLVGTPSGVVVDAIGTPNAEQSALVYKVDAAAQLRIDRDAQAAGLEVIGAFHSHTHTDAWPSATDVATAVDPSWHWVIVSLRRPQPVVRSFAIVDGRVERESIRVC